MPMPVPVSAAMDATSPTPPISILPRLVTGDPEGIAAHVSQLLAKAAQFAQLLEQFEQASQQLGQAWSGAASQSALAKIGQSLKSFEQIIKTVQEGAALLGISGGLVKTAQTGYQTVVSAVNPTVASLMSNPWTYGAAVALSTASSGALTAFVEAIELALEALGAGQLAMEVMQLVQIITQLEQLLGSGSKPGSTTTSGQQPTAPVYAPPPPTSVASDSGTGAIGTGTSGSTTGATATGTGTGTGTGPALPTAPTYGTGTGTASGTGMGTGTGTGTGTGPALPTAPTYGTGSTSDNSWTPVDPPATTATPVPAPSAPVPVPAAPVTAPAGHGDDIVVTVTENGSTTTVDVPVGHEVDVDISSSGHTEILVDGHAMAHSS